jgi:replicative DNA helicase
MSTEAQSLPYSEDAEKGVLCSLILSPDVREKCASGLKPDVFYVPAHEITYNLLLEYNQPQEKVDFVWLKQTLKDRGLLDEVGGPEFLNELYNFVPTASAADYYIGIVGEKFTLRRLIQECGTLANRCYDQQEDVPRLLDGARKIASIADEASVSAARTPVIEFLSPSQIRSYEPPPGIVLVGDNHVVRGNVTVVGGCPGVGKSRASVALAEAGATGYHGSASRFIANLKPLSSRTRTGVFV